MKARGRETRDRLLVQGLERERKRGVKRSCGKRWRSSPLLFRNRRKCHIGKWKSRKQSSSESRSLRFSISWRHNNHKHIWIQLAWTQTNCQSSSNSFSSPFLRLLSFPFFTFSLSLPFYLENVNHFSSTFKNPFSFSSQNGRKTWPLTLWWYTFCGFVFVFQKVWKWETWVKKGERERKREEEGEEIEIFVSWVCDCHARQIRCLLPGIVFTFCVSHLCAPLLSLSLSLLSIREKMKRWIIVSTEEKKRTLVYRGGRMRKREKKVGVVVNEWKVRRVRKNWAKE